MGPRESLHRGGGNPSAESDRLEGDSFLGTKDGNQFLSLGTTGPGSRSRATEVLREEKSGFCKRLNR